jgi:thiol:disulfide interchange protein
LAARAWIAARQASRLKQGRFNPPGIVPGRSNLAKDRPARDTLEVTSMKFVTATLTMWLLMLAAQAANAQEPTDYRTAYNRAKEGEKPLLVLVTADWCPPCQIMKKTTFPKLMEKKAFDKFNFSKVDLDKEEKLGRQLMGNQGIPQLIMFEKQGDKWIKRNLVGIQTPEQIEAFLYQASSIRLAKSTTDTIEK